MNVEKYRYDYAGSRMAKIGNLSTFPCRYEPYQYLISPSAFIEQGEIFYKKFTNNICIYPDRIFELFRFKCKRCRIKV